MGEPIENHGVIGDLRTVALVALDGAIDFLCWPRFDSPSIFASILDDERGGRFELAPELNDARRRQLYLPDTNVLLTRFLSRNSVAELSDFFALGYPDNGQRLIRRAKAVRGVLRLPRCGVPRASTTRGRSTTSTRRTARSCFVRAAPMAWRFDCERACRCKLRMARRPPSSSLRPASRLPSSLRTRLTEWKVRRRLRTT